MKRKEMDALRQADLTKAKLDGLADLNSVNIDADLPVEQRVASFVQQVGNPYCFRIGDLAVKVKYREDGPTFQQNMEDLLRTL